MAPVRLARTMARAVSLSRISPMIKKMLEQWGYQVFAVEDFMEVLTLFVKEEPQLVLMDIFPS